MKKVLIAAALAGIIGFAGIQAATADPGFGYGYGPCRDYSIGRQYNDETSSKAQEKFLEETAALRKEIVVKQSAYDALMQQDNPDEKKAAQLSGELFDLQTALENKAEERGITGNFACNGPGSGMMWGNGGWGRGHHMRGW
jgi:hypothetical protein